MKTTLTETLIEPGAPQLRVAAARLALSCLDLTDLSDNCGPAEIQALCWRAQGADQALPSVAAVCVWPRLAALARQQLPASIAVAAVVNFPGGDLPLMEVLRQVDQIRHADAQEVDLVLPYQQLLAGNEVACVDMLQDVREASAGLVLKVILETGELKRPELIAQASQLALDYGADFLKTSTGKTAQGATLEAARIMLQTIQSHSRAAHLGFKASGGLRTVDDVWPYLDLVRKLLGPQALSAARLRIGASSLWSDIVQVLGSNELLSETPSNVPNGY